MTKLLTQYQELSEIEKEKVSSVLGDQLRVESKKGFICPQTKVSVVLPCSLKECFYHIKSPWSKNCVLCYMYQQNLDRLTPTELAFLYKMPLEKITEIYDVQMVKIRDRFLKEKLSNENKITYLNDVPICCVCDKKTESDIKIQGLTFCGKKCLKEKPLYIFEIEKRYRSDIETILAVALKMFKNLDVIEKLLNISRKRLEYTISKFAKILMNKFISLTNTNELFAIKESRSIVCEKSLSKMKKGLLQFGISQNTLKPIYNKFCVGLEKV